MGRKRRASRRCAAPDAVPPPTAAQRVASLLEIPIGVLNNTPHIEMSGNREIVIEGCKGVLEYDSDTVRISLGKSTLRISGRALDIRVLTDDTAIIAGNILCIEFLL